MPAVYSAPAFPSKITPGEFFVAILSVSVAVTWLSAGSGWWWSHDDPQILKYAISHCIGEIFFSPGSWRELSASNLTPWLSVSFKADMCLSGLCPVFFHIHQCVSVGACLLLFYMVCRLWLGPLASLAAGTLFLFSRPLMEAMSILMVRHYVEGLAFSLGAVLCFVRGVRTGGYLWRISCAVLYSLACISKEIYVPLPALFLVFPMRDLKARLTVIWPLFVLLGLYIPWRLWMLGALGRGYGRQLSFFDLLSLPSRVLEISGYENAWLICLFMLAAVAGFFLTKTRSRVFVSVTSACVLLPILPVSSMMSPRYALLPALLAAFCVGWWLQRYVQPRKMVTVSAALAISFSILAIFQLWVSNIREWKPAFDRDLGRIKVEGRYVLDKGGPRDFIYKPADAPWFYSGLAWLRTEMFGRPAGPRTFYDPVFLDGRSGYRILTYNPASGTLVEDRDFSSRYRSFLSRIKWKAPLYASVRYREPLVKWRLGPWKKGSYAFIYRDESCQIVYPMPVEGRIPFQFRDDFAFRIRYISPEGWTTYSPVLLLKIRNRQGKIHWNRARER